MLMRPLISRLEDRSPHLSLVISSFTPTGKLAAEKAYGSHRVIYLPLDLSFIIRRFLKRLRPRAIILVEAEFWPNLILTASRYHVPVILLNGKLSERSYRIYKNSRLLVPILKKISLFAVQNDEYASRFRQLGIPAERIKITGNMKYDLTDLTEMTVDTTGLKQELGYPSESRILIGGSIHPGEEEALIYAFNRLKGEGYDLRLILVPRYLESVPQIESIITDYGFIPVRKSLRDKGQQISLQDPSKILVVDTIGELKTMYGIADIAYVGGSLFYRGPNKGGHNMMEPAILKKAVIFGPYNFTFKDTVEELLNNRAALEVSDREAIYEEVKGLLLNPQRLRELGERAYQVAKKNLGATQRNLDLLTPYLPEPVAQPD